MPRYLVTGGAGFIGSHLVDALIARGDEVVVLDNFNAFYDPAIKRRNVERHAGSDRFKLVEGDIRDRDAVARALDGAIDQVVHLAAMAGVRPSLADPELYVDVNLRGTATLLEALTRKGVPEVVFASSSSVYGANERTPFSEDDPVDHPVSPYAATKKAGELLAYTYHHIHGTAISCLRFFTVYGPRQRPEMAIHKFVRSIDEGRPITMFGDGKSRRDYTFVDDVIQGVLGAMTQTRRFGYRVWNLGESRTIELADLVRTIEAALGKEAIVERLPDQPGDVPATWADVSRAQEELGYEPRTTVEDGIAAFVSWYRDEKKAEKR